MQENYLGFPGEQWDLQKPAAVLEEQQLIKNHTSQICTPLSALSWDPLKQLPPIQTATAPQYRF